MRILSTIAKLAIRPKNNEFIYSAWSVALCSAFASPELANLRFLPSGRLIQQEDTDGDFQITVSDQGPKVFAIGTAASAGYHKFELRGTYQISNLLQELALAADHGRQRIMVDEDRLRENPVERLARMIRYDFWDGLSRRIDAEGERSNPENWFVTA